VSCESDLQLAALADNTTRLIYGSERFAMGLQCGNSIGEIRRLSTAEPSLFAIICSLPCSEHLAAAQRALTRAGASRRVQYGDEVGPSGLSSRSIVVSARSCRVPILESVMTREGCLAAGVGAALCSFFF